MTGTVIMLFGLIGVLIGLHIWAVFKFQEALANVIGLQKQWANAIEDIMDHHDRNVTVQQARWAKERSELLDRITASNLAEYKHLTGERTTKPRVSNPTRKMLGNTDEGGGDA